MPPINKAEFALLNFDRARVLSRICIASSRVGATIKARQWRGPADCSSSAILWSKGSTNAAVLPEPVCDRPTQSRPSIAAGISALWMGVGVVKPCVVTPRRTASFKPRSSKFVKSWGIFHLARVVERGVGRQGKGCKTPAGTARRNKKGNDHSRKLPAADTGSAVREFDKPRKTVFPKKNRQQVSPALIAV